MNIRKYKLTILCLAMALSAPLCLANDSSQSSNHETSASMHKEYRFSKLAKAEITSSTGEKLGEVEDLTINPSNGKIDFLILGKGGFLDIGEKYVAVPWDKVTSASSKELTLSVNKPKIQGAPKLNKDFSNLKDQAFRSSVYQYFGDSPNVGAAGTPTGTLSGQNSGKTAKAQ